MDGKNGAIPRRDNSRELNSYKILPVPLDGRAQSFLEADLRFVSQMLSCACDIGLRMFDITASGLRINGRDVHADDFVDLMKHRIHCNSIAASDIENFPADSWYFAREQIRFNHILDVGEVTRLQAVPINRGPAALQYCRNE